uniref:Xylulose kinase-1 n=1 Tax=Tanacetum cinerariifolium TaxID=118510 RepID=A0A699GNW7_TANCI|nr:hypothetical protein [Tanacetum cinerariifolium]
MVAYLTKSNAREGFNQVIDFLNGSYIKHALTINPHIYVSCIKQFWNTIIVKQSNDVTRLQALVNQKKVVIMEATIRDALRLEDAEGVDCLPNEEIFAELARMGYEKQSTKLTFYKAFFSSQLKRVGKGFSGVETPLFEGMLVGVIEEQGDDVPEPSIPSPTPPTPPPQQSQDLPSTSQVKKPEIGNKVKVLKLRRLKKVGTSQRIESFDDTVMEDASNQGRMIDALDSDAGVVLMDDKQAEKKAEEAIVAGDDQVRGRQAKIYQIDMDHASKVQSMQEDEPEVHEVVDVVTTAKLITEVVTTAIRVVVASTRRRKGVVIRDLEEVSTTIIPVDTKSKDKGKGIMVEEPKPLEKKQHVKMDEEYQVMKKRPQTEAQAQRTMIMYLKNVAGFRLDYIKGMYYDDIRPIFEAKFNSNIEFLLKIKEQLEEEENRAIQSINETSAQKSAKRRKLNEEGEDLK